MVWSRSRLRTPGCVQGSGSVMTEDPVSGITPAWVKLPAKLNKNNYHLLSAYYVPDTTLNVYTHYLIKSSQPPSYPVGSKVEAHSSLVTCPDLGLSKPEVCLLNHCSQPPAGDSIFSSVKQGQYPLTRGCFLD
jgi:hypothetical protein